LCITRIYALPGRGSDGGRGGRSGLAAPGGLSSVTHAPNNSSPNNVSSNRNNPVVADHCMGYGVSINPCGPNTLHRNNDGRTVVRPTYCPPPN